MIINHTRTLKLKRRQVCDLLIAINVAAMESDSDKWNDLHKEVKRQLAEQDIKAAKKKIWILMTTIIPLNGS